MKTELKNKIEEIDKQIEYHEDNCMGFYEIDISDNIDNFMKKWTGSNFPHLCDSDENDGQRLKVWVYISQLKEKRKAILNSYKDVAEYVLANINNEENYNDDLVYELNEVIKYCEEELKWK